MRDKGFLVIGSILVAGFGMWLVTHQGRPIQPRPIETTAQEEENFSREEQTGGKAVAPQTGLDMDRTGLELLGTVMSREPASGQILKEYAVLEDLASHRLGTYELKDEVKGWRLVQISLGSVTLLKEGRKVTLSLAASGKGRLVIELSATERLISRQRLNEEVKNLQKSWEEVQLVPYIQEGRMKGLEIRAIDKESIMSTIGVLAGDVVEEVNGRPIRSFQEAARMVQALRKEIHNNPTVRVKIQRQETPKTLTYTLY